MSGHHRKERSYVVGLVEAERESLLACMDYALGRGPRPDGPREALVDLAYRFDRMPERSDRGRALWAKKEALTKS